MKKALTLAAFLFAFTLSSSQETWYTQIPYETGDPNSNIRRLVQSSVDGSFYVLLQKFDADDKGKLSALLFKYSANGEYIWEKDYDLFEGDSLGYGQGTHPFDILELPAGDLVICGQLKTNVEQGFLLKVSPTGEVLTSNQDEPGIETFNELEYYQGKLYASSGDAADTYYIHEVNIPSLSLLQPLIESPSKILYYTFFQNGIVVRRVGVLESIVGKYDIQGNLLFEKIFAYYSIIKKITANNTLDQLAAYCKDTLWILDSELEEQSFEPVINIQALGSSGNISQEVFELQASSEGGYLAVGSTAPWGVPFDQHLSFIIVLNLDGSMDWGYAYSQFYMPLTTIRQIEETDDGYVIVGGHSGTERLWLVKLTKEGLLSTSDKPEETTPLEVFPNPFSSCFEVDHTLLSSGNYSLQIHDLQGRLLLNIDIDQSTSHQVCPPNFPSGAYLLSLVDTYGKVMDATRIIKY